MRVHVFIATTAGPVRIQYVERHTISDDPGYHAHMSVNDSPYATINRQYVHFVNLVINRRFRHRQFGLSVEKDIQKGKSWQLAVLLAHAVEADGKCSLVEEEVLEGDWVVLATGEVTNRLAIKPVDNIGDKFKEARERLDSWLDAGSRVAVVLPKGNRDDVPPEFSSYHKNGNRLTLVDSDNVDDLLSQLHHSGLFDGPVAATAAETEVMAGVSHGMRTAPAPRPPTRRGWKGVWWMTAGVFCLVAILAYNESMPGSMRGAIGVGRDLGAWIMTEAMKLMEFEATDDSPEKSRDETAMVPKVVLPVPDDNPDGIPTRDIE
ncbi:MAG: hypothetical protein OXI10_00030 [Gammaproteobacteria bacterium]|nr:hypothetical protein [Gammaproteobacteria bacterium]